MGRHRDQMITHMRMRNLSDRTQANYLYAAKRFIAFHRRPADQLGKVDIEAFLLHLRDDLGLGDASVKMHVAALRYLYRRVLDLPEVVAEIPLPKVVSRRPEVLAPDEVAALLAAAATIKHRALLSTAYDCGLRVGEVVTGQTTDLDAAHHLLHVRRGKGARHRVVRLGDTLIDLLRRYWRLVRPPAPWVFAGRGDRHLSIRAAQHAVHRAAERAGLSRRVCFHALRHSYATHMLEDGASVYTLQAVLGHKRERTTRRYVHIRTAHIAASEGPLARL